MATASRKEQGPIQPAEKIPNELETTKMFEVGKH
jgi:hypothetical protein